MKKSEKYLEYKRPGESVNPYKGLDSYEKEDKDRFFGREMEKKELFRLVRLNLNTLVIGKSGIGKTSLLNAGLFPQLEGSGFFPIRLRLNYLLSESDLMGKVRNVIGDALKRYSKRGSEGNETVVGIKCGETLWEYFHRVRHQDEMGNKFITPVLVFDQFEEIFTRGKNHPRIIELIDELYWLIETQIPDAFQELILEGQEEFPYLDSRPDVRVIISLREDYLPHLSDLKSRLPSIDKVTFRVKHMQKDQAEEVIMMPGGIQDERMAEQILALFKPEGMDRDAPKEKWEVEPLFLSLLCYQLFGKLGLITKHSDVLLINKKVQNEILTNFYDSVLRMFPSDVEEFIESSLLTKGGFRTPFYVEPGHKYEDSIKSLVEFKILRRVHINGKEHIEIIHDVLTPIIVEKRSRRARKKKSLIIGVLLILLGIFITLTWLSFSMKEKADENYKDMLLFRLTLEANLALPSDNYKAIRLAEAAFKISSPNPPPRVQQALCVAAFSMYERPFYCASMKHSDQVNSAVFSSKGKQILTCSDDNTARLWNLKGGKLVEFRHRGAVYSAIFSPDGKQILTASRDGTAKLWDLTGGILVKFRHRDVVYSATFSPDGKQILTASRDGTAKLWDMKGNVLVEFPHTSWVNSAVFSPDGRKILTSSLSGYVRLWDLQGGLIEEFSHSGPVNLAVFSPDGKQILTTSGSGMVEVWDLQGNVVARLNHQSIIYSAAFSPGGTQLVTTSRDGTVKLWDLQGGIINEFVHSDSVNYAVFSPGGKQILTCSTDNTAKLWDLHGRILSEFKHSGAVYSAAFSPGGTQLLTTSGDNTAKLWNLPGSIIVGFAHNGPVNSAQFSPDGEQILTCSTDNTAKLWDLHGIQLAEMIHKAEVHSAIYSPDGKHILTSSADYTVRLWDLQGNILTNLIHNVSVHAAFFSKDGKKIYTFSADDKVRLWDLHGRRAPKLMNRDEFYSNVFSPYEGQILTTSTENPLNLLGVPGVLLSKFMDRNKIFSTVISPDRKKILTRSTDNTVKLWDLSGNLLADFNKHKDTVTSAFFSPDGTKILTASVDGNAILWYTPEAIIEWLETSGIPRLSSEERKELGIELDR